MKKSILLITAIMILGIFGNTFAQDPSFSQYYTAGQYTNPAMTGVFEGGLRINANYRAQWSTVFTNNPFRTYAAGVDKRTRLGKGDFLAYGLLLSHDQAGEARYRRTTGTLSVSFLKQLNGSRYRTSDQYLIAGIQAGLGQHGLDYQKLWFSNQFNTNGDYTIDFDAPNGESFNNKSDIYPDINAGLLWYALFGKNMSLYAGGAVHHVNTPKISFLGNPNEHLYMKWTAMAGGEIPFSSEFSALPAFIFTKQGPSLISIFGGNFRYTAREWHEIAIRAGGWMQLSNHLESEITIPNLIFSAILEMDRWLIGVSYDVNIGDLTQPTDHRGGLELSLIYVKPAVYKTKVKCPKF